MSTLRYSGNLTIRVTYFDACGETYSDGTLRNANGKYRCFIKSRDGERVTVWVGAPAFLSHAVDSPKAFDDAARAAIAFADDEKRGWGDEAYSNDRGYVIGRTEARRWIGSDANLNATVE